MTAQFKIIVDTEGEGLEKAENIDRPLAWRDKWGQVIQPHKL
jgi:hypothetical protein